MKTVRCYAATQYNIPTGNKPYLQHIEDSQPTGRDVGVGCLQEYRGWVDFTHKVRMRAA